MYKTYFKSLVCVLNTSMSGLTFAKCQTMVWAKACLLLLMQPNHGFGVAKAKPNVL